MFGASFLSTSAVVVRTESVAAAFDIRLGKSIGRANDALAWGSKKEANYAGRLRVPAKCDGERRDAPWAVVGSWR
jgi:hypothetical protein